ncbi:MAG: hypothetical protein ACTIJ9_11095 [Aequorivita sp.]
MAFLTLIFVLAFLFGIGYLLRKFKFFRNKRNWMWLLFVFLLIYFLGNLTFIYRTIELRFEKLPEEYSNYVHLGKLDSMFLNSNFKAIKLESIYREEAVRINDSIIILKTHEDGEGEHKTNVSWYKLNSNGELIDSLTFKGEYIVNVDSYLVNIENSYYVTWLRDGDTLKKPFDLMEDGKLMDEAQSKEFLKGAAYSNYDYYYENKNDYDREKRFKKMIVYKNNEWFQFNTSDDLYLSVNEYFANKDLDFEDRGKLVHFQKEAWYGDRFPDFNLYINGKDPNHWKGTAYLNLDLENELFKIQHYSKLYKDGDALPIPLDIYENPNKSFYILRIESGEAHTFYVLKNKF